MAGGKYSVFKNVYAYPLKANTDSYAFYNSSKKLIIETLSPRTYAVPFYPLPFDPKVKKIIFPYIYTGFLFDHFGHFIIESLSRLWFAKNYPEVPICWTARNGFILDFQKDIFNLLGIKNEITIIDQPACFATLFVPEPGFIIHDYFYPYYDDFLSVVIDIQPIIGKKVYISRRYFGGESCLTNDEELENVLNNHGFIIYYPEKHSIYEQITFLSSAEKILALEGSALHTLIFVKDLQSNILIMPRPKASINQNYLTIAKRKGFRQSYIPPE